MSSQALLHSVGLAKATKKLVEKQAAEQKAFGEQVEQTIDTLIKAGSAKAEDRDNLVASMTQDPSKALAVMNKLAEANQTLTSKVNTLKKKSEENKGAGESDTVKKAALGGPSAQNPEKTAANARSESDRIWESTFGC